jgi:UDP-glucuronate 4-epimerase
VFDRKYLKIRLAAGAPGGVHVWGREPTQPGHESLVVDAAGGEDPIGMSAVPWRRAVVTGAAGFIGSHLTEALLSRGRQVLGIDAFTTYYPPASKRGNLADVARHPGFELLAGDLNELDLNEILRPGDLVFHLAGQPGVRASWGDGFTGYSRNNIDATQRLLEAALRRGAARVVLASSSSVYGEAPLPMVEDGPTMPSSPYGLTKLAAEQLSLVYANNFGLQVVPLRFFTVYGPRQRPDMAFNKFIDSLVAGRPVRVFGDGHQLRDFTYVGDAVVALLAAAESRITGRPVNVGGGSAVSVRQAIGILEDLLGRHAILEFEPAPAGDARDTLADTTRLRQLGVKPRTRIEEGLRRQVEWWLGSRPRRRLPGAAPRSRRETRPVYVLYSHDTYGLGHLRRNTAIAHAIFENRPDARVAMITGSPVAASWPLPRGIEVIQLPPVVKVDAESYRPVDDRSMAGLMAERSGIICSALARLQPDAFLVDHAPLGMKGELRLALQLVRERMPETWTVLGMRDILDEPAEVRRVWEEQGALHWMEACYDRVLVYGSRELFDVGREYGLGPQLVARTRYTGYVAKKRDMEPPIRDASSWRLAHDRNMRILVSGGGGGDAAPLLAAFISAWPQIRAEVPAQALLVTGPLMDGATRREIEHAAARTPGIELLASSHGMLSVIDAADVVVSMGGYNSVVEAVAARKRLVLCPRVRPRREQMIRSEIFAGLGLAHTVTLVEVGEAGLARAVIDAATNAPASPSAWERIDLKGGARAAAELVRPVAAQLSQAV